MMAWKNTHFLRRFGKKHWTAAIIYYNTFWIISNPCCTRTELLPHIFRPLKKCWQLEQKCYFTSRQLFFSSCPWFLGPQTPDGDSDKNIDVQKIATPKFPVEFSVEQKRTPNVNPLKAQKTPHWNLKTCKKNNRAFFPFAGPPLFESLGYRFSQNLGWDFIRIRRVEMLRFHGRFLMPLHSCKLT